MGTGIFKKFALSIPGHQHDVKTFPQKSSERIVSLPLSRLRTALTICLPLCFTEGASEGGLSGTMKLGNLNKALPECQSGFLPQTGDERPNSVT